MKTLHSLTASLVALAFVAAPFTALSADAKKPKPYPLDVCVVSGEKLGGDMGEAYVFDEGGQQVMLCCKSCLKDFNKDKAKYIAKIDAAAKNVKPYAKTTCIVSGKELKDGGNVFIVKGQEFKTCCKDCEKEVRKDVDKFLAKLK
jgi:hypothetical protein